MDMVLRYIRNIEPELGAVAQWYRKQDHELLPEMGPGQTEYHPCLVGLEGVDMARRPGLRWFFASRGDGPERETRSAGALDYIDLFPIYHCGGAGLNLDLAAAERETARGLRSGHCDLAFGQSRIDRGHA